MLFSRKAVVMSAIAVYSSFSMADILPVVEATDWGGADSRYPAANAIDGDTRWSSRWAAQDLGSEVNLVLDLGSVKTVSAVNIAWGHGDESTNKFEIRSRSDASDTTWDKIFAGNSRGATTGFESYDVGDIQARWIRIKAFSNSTGSDWTNITEVNMTGSNTPDYGLDSSKAPSDNFDLLDWYLSIPVDKGDGYATSIKEAELSASYEDEFFYTGADGGMVFYTTVKGVKTSENTKYVRTELREMLRRGDTSKSTSGTDNNWAFSSIPSDDQAAFGGIDGHLHATLAVNHVTTTTSKVAKVGRIVIGQIHAQNNEPIRLYYHKLPGNSKGAIYFAHEASKASGGAETWYNLLGAMVSSEGGLNETADPSDGIALDEHFSYEIDVVGDSLTVIISQNGAELAKQIVDMADSGYDVSDNYMYFKAGIYLQDNTSDDDDYAQATFYQLVNKHQNYAY